MRKDRRPAKGNRAVLLHRPSEQRLREIVEALPRESHRQRLLQALNAGLGHRPDRDVAIDLGVGRTTIRGDRRLLGIPLDWHAVREGIASSYGPERSDEELAKEIQGLLERGYGVGQITDLVRVPRMRVRRVALAHGLSLPHPWSRTLWAAVDWQMSDAEIADRLGEPVDTVRAMRRFSRRVSRPHPGRRRRKKYWSKYWEREYGPIARRMCQLRDQGLLAAQVREALGLSIPYFQRVAKHFKIRFPRVYNLRRNKLQLARRIAPLARRGLTGNAIEERTGICQERVRKIALEFGIRLGTPKRVDWSRADWTQSNPEIARRLGTTPRTVSQERKKRRSRGCTVPSANEAYRVRAAAREPSLVRALRRLAPKGIGRRKMAKMLHVRIPMMVRLAERHGIVLVSPKSRRYGDPQLVDRVRDLAARGLGVTRIALETRVSPWLVHRVAAQAGISIPSNAPPGRR